MDSSSGVQVRDGGDGALVTWEPVGSDACGASVDLNDRQEHQVRLRGPGDAAVRAGVVHRRSEGPRTAVEVDLATGTPEALPPDTDVLFRPLRDTALFVPLIGGGDTPAVQVLRHR